MTKWVYRFGDGTAEGRADMKNLLGGKGAGLAEMSNLGLPVPPGFTITTEVCTHFYAQRQVLSRRSCESRGAPTRSPHIERSLGAQFGDADNPLLVSVRSGARVSMPGMMDTVLNLGLNDETVVGPGAQETATSASPMTAIAASSRCTARSCSASTTIISRSCSRTTS